MAEPIVPRAEAIVPAGDAEWFPPAEDDAEAARTQRQPHGPGWILYGANGLRAGWSLLLFGVLVFSLSQGLFWLLTRVLGPTPQGREQKLPVVVLAEYLTLAVLALSAWSMSKVERRTFSTYGLDAPLAQRLRQFALGCVLGFGLLSLLVLTLKVSGLLVLSGSLLHGGAVVRWGFGWAVAFAGVGLAEEFTTRGFVQFTLSRGLAGVAAAMGLGARACAVAGFWTAALFFSILFGLGHVNNAGESPIGLLSAGLIGLVFAFSLWRTGSLWWAIGFHAAWDWAQSFVYGVGDSGQFVEHHWLVSHPQGTPLMSGGLTGPEGSIYVLGAVALTTVAVAVLLPSQPGSPSDPASTPKV